MRILIIDHKERLLSFEAGNQWSRNFLMNAKLFSTKLEAQDYIDDFIKKFNDFDVKNLLQDEERVKNLLIVNIKNGQEMEKIEPKNLGPSWENGITVISLPQKQALSLSYRAERESIFGGVLFLIPCFGKSLSQFFPSESLDYYKNLDLLFEKSYLIVGEESMSEIEKDRALSIFKEGIKHMINVKEGKITDDRITPSNTLEYKLSNLTLWRANNYTNYKEREPYIETMKCLFNSGLIISPRQEQYWHNYFARHNQKEAIVFDFLIAYREKQEICQKIMPSAKNNLHKSIKNKV